MNPKQAISGIVQNVKTESSKWIKEKEFCGYPFRWQEGFGAFCLFQKPRRKYDTVYTESGVHHEKQTFLKEYKKMLEGFNVSYDDRYIFTDLV